MPPSFEDDLLRHERFLLRLARRLARGEGQAEDLVQDVYVRALERPPVCASTLRAWLATVLRRVASHSARGARRRAAREQAAARPESASECAGAIDARLDAHAELLALLRDLPQHERQALFLRYSEDLAPPVIAKRLGVPLDTLKTRLRRAREHLRTRLDARHHGRDAWAALLLPAAGRAWPPAPSASFRLASNTGLVMGATSKLVLSAAACIGAALVVWIASQHELRATRPPSPLPRAMPTAELAAERASPARSTAERTVRIAAATALGDAPALAEHAPASSAPWPLIVRVVGASAQGAAVNVQARLDAWGRYDIQALEGVVGEHGEAHFDIAAHLAELLAHAGGARPEELVVSIEAPDLVPAENGLILPDPLDLRIAPSAPLEVVVNVERASIATGRLVDESGAALAGERAVQAHALRGASIEYEDSGGVEPADDGSFRLRIDGEGPHALCALAAGRRPTTLRVELQRGSVLQLGDLVVRPGLSIGGSLLDASGLAVESASVVAGLLSEQGSARLHRFSLGLPMTIAWHEQAFELTEARAVTGAAGRFRIDGLGAYAYRLDARAPEEWAPFDLSEQAHVIAPATVLLGPRAAVLLLEIACADGIARAGTLRWSRGFERAECEVGAERVGMGRPLRYALPPDERIDLELVFDGLPTASLELETPAAGGVLERALVLAPGPAAAGVVLLLQGAPVADGMRFTAVLFEGERQSERALEARGGELVLGELAPGPLRIILNAGSDRFAPEDHVRDVEIALELAPGEERRVPVELLRGGTLVLEARTANDERIEATCIVSTAEGEPLDLVFVARLPNGRVAAHNHLFESGPARAVPELAAGRYRARIEAQGYAPEEFDVLIEAGQTTERSVRLRPTP